MKQLQNGTNLCWHFHSTAVDGCPSITCQERAETADLEFVGFERIYRVAAGSFFSIRERVAKILPEPFLSTSMRALPILLIFVAMFYWLWRLRSRSRQLEMAL